MGVLRRAPVLVVAVFVLAFGLTIGRGAAADGCAGVLCAGAASVDMTWHVGAGQGQHGTEGGQVAVDRFDPFVHSVKQGPSDGILSRSYAKAIVVRGPDGTKVAYAKTDLYLSQDLLTRRVGELVSGADPLVTDYAVPDLNAENVMLGATHNHSSPYESSVGAGVWAFTDVFDFRMFELTARKIAGSIKAADEALVPASVGASVSHFDEVQRNILGPNVADDGSPAGFPFDYFDDELAVVRFDAVDGGAPIAAWVNLGMHPESNETFDKLSADFVGITERMVERDLGRAPGASGGPVVAWSQGAVGDVEPDQAGRANPTSAKREYWHRNVAQSEAMSQRLAAAVLDTWKDVAAGTPQIAAKYVPPATNVPVAMTERRFAGPLAHPLPTVSNCRTAHPGVPVVGLPDCERPGDAPPELGQMIDALKGAGIPVPDNYGVPAYNGVEETTTLRLQALRIGQILIASCSCEPISDLVLNFKSRTDVVDGNLHNGFDWPCEDRGATGIFCNFQTAAHQPASWRPVERHAYDVMRAQVRNDAAGWEDDLASLQGESESVEPSEIYGNFTHSEISDVACGGQPCGGFTLPIMVSHSNDYNGYTVTYREYSRGDHYRKALTSYGPHTADYINTRLVGLAAMLRGGPAVGDPVTSMPTAPVDDALEQIKTKVFGAGATLGVEAYDALIPDDGGTPGRIVRQPTPIGRFDAASVSWEGGSNWTDSPLVTIERRVGDRWETFGTQEGGEVVLDLAYESPLSTAAIDWITGGKTYTWTAIFEAFDATPAGTYRFVVEGDHRSGRAAVPYTVTSDPFAVDVWRGIEAYDLSVDVPARTASFRVAGTERSVPAAQLETDDDGIISPGEVHYPDSHTAPSSYISRTMSTIGEHRYCFRCTFRAWANTGRIGSAVVSVRHANGTVHRYPATLAGDLWVARGLQLARGDTVAVEPGGVTDVYGNRNGEGTTPAGPFEGLDPLVIPTRVRSTSPSGASIGQRVPLSAVLETADGEPVAGQRLMFTLNRQTVSATTDETGVATAMMRVRGPSGNRRLSIRFAGADPYPAAQAVVPFRVRST